MAITVGGARPHPQNGTVKRKGTQPRPNPVHAGSGRQHGILHAPPSPGSAVNRGGTFGMGTLKKGKRS
jgi:hypothetical protein